MAETKAQLNYLRIAPRKVREVASVIRGRNAQEAAELLEHTRRRAAQPLAKLVRSAIANASHNHDLDENTLRISRVEVNQGPMLKRYRPRAMGRATEIQKKMSHVTVILESES